MKLKYFGLRIDFIMKVTALVVAAGESTRFGNKTKKQFYRIAGKPILVHALMALNHSRIIARIVLVVPEKDINEVNRNIIEKYQLRKITDIVPGGKDRSDSVWNGLQAIYNSDLVLIHDGVRPFITEQMIRDTVHTAQKSGAAIMATKITDTIKFAESDLIIKKTVPRDNLWGVQTPQVFKFSLLFTAYQQARKKKIKVTDDAGILEYFGIPVTLVPGSITNIKITTKQDINIAEAILKQSSAARFE